MVSIIALAAFGGLAAAAATAVSTGDASAAVNAVHAAVPHGLQVALAHVPSATHAHQVLTQHLAAYTQNGAGGAAGTAGLEGVRRGLHLGLKH